MSAAAIANVSATDSSAATGRAAPRTATPSRQNESESFAALIAGMALSSYADGTLSGQVRLGAFTEGGDLDRMLSHRVAEERDRDDERPSRRSAAEQFRGPAADSVALVQSTAQAAAPADKDGLDGSSTRSERPPVSIDRPMLPTDAEGPKVVDAQPKPPFQEPAVVVRRVEPAGTMEDPEHTKRPDGPSQRTAKLPIKAQIDGPPRQATSLPSTALSASASLTAQSTEAQPGIPQQTRLQEPALDIAAEPVAHGLATPGQKAQRGGRAPTQAINAQTSAANATASASDAQAAKPTVPMLQQAIASTPETLQVAAGNQRLPTEPGLRPAMQPSADGLFSNGQAGTGGAHRLFAPGHAAKTHPQLPPRFVSQQVAVQIQKAFGQGTDRITIQLKPIELGRVDVRLDVGQDGRVSVAISTDRQDTLDMLQRDARALQSALQDAGLRADSDSLSFSLRHQQAGFGEQGDKAQHGGSEQVSSTVTDAEPTIPQPRHIVAKDHVDISV